MGYINKLKAFAKTLRALPFILHARWQTYNLYRSAFKDAPVVLQDTFGIKFILYPWDRPYIRNFLQRTNDKAQFRAISRLIQPDSVFFDAGAHIGRYSVFANHILGPKGRIFAFEPVPDTYWMLCQTLALNRCKKVIPLQKALYSEVGTITMNLFNIQYSEWNTIGIPLMTTREGKRVTPSSSVIVDCDTIDHFSAKEGINRINFLKVDVEGFEKSVFLGANGLLRERLIDYICFEISQDPLKGAGFTGKEIFEMLEAYGYLAYQFHEKSGTFHGPVYDSHEYYANYFASWRDLSKFQLNENTNDNMR